MNLSEIRECIVCGEDSGPRTVRHSIGIRTCNHGICRSCFLKYLNEVPDGDYSQDHITILCPGFLCYMYKYTLIENNSPLHNEVLNWWKHVFQKKTCISYKVRIN